MDSVLSIRVRSQKLRDGGRSVYITVPINGRSSVGFGAVIPGDLLAQIRSLAQQALLMLMQPAPRPIAFSGPTMDVQQLLEGAPVEGWRFRAGRGYVGDAYPYIGDAYPYVGDAGQQATSILSSLAGLIPAVGPLVSQGVQALGNLINPQPSAAQNAATASTIASGVNAVREAMERARAGSGNANQPGLAPVPPGTIPLLPTTPTPALSSVGPLPQVATGLANGSQGSAVLAGGEVLAQALNTLLSVPSLRASLEPEIARTLATALRAMETTAGAALGSERAKAVLRQARLQTANEVSRGLELARLITAP